jgi:uncharacterized membrane protein
MKYKREQSMPVQITKSIIVQGKVKDLYQMWTQFETFPNFMDHIKSVQKIDDQTSHWVMAIGPSDQFIEWTAETTLLEENKRIAWNSKAVSKDEFKTSGQVTFTALPNAQTEVTFVFQLASLTHLPEPMQDQLEDDLEEKWTQALRSFKAYAEGRQHPAQAIR